MRLLGALVLCLLLVGCMPGREPVESPTSEVTTVSPSPSVEVSPSVVPTTVSPSPEPTAFQSYPADMPTADAESAAIIAGWQEYQRVYEKFAKDPNGFTDFTETQHVTTGHESSVILDRIDAYRDNNLELVGGLTFRDVRVEGLSEQPDGTSTAEILYCWDLNTLQVRDTTTGELAPRSGAFEEIAYMRKGLDGVWRVEGLDSQDEQC